MMSMVQNGGNEESNAGYKNKNVNKFYKFRPPLLGTEPDATAFVDRFLSFVAKGVDWVVGCAGGTIDSATGLSLNVRRS